MVVVAVVVLRKLPALDYLRILHRMILNVQVVVLKKMKTCAPSRNL